MVGAGGTREAGAPQSPTSGNTQESGWTGVGPGAAVVLEFVALPGRPGPRAVDRGGWADFAPSHIAERRLEVTGRSQGSGRSVEINGAVGSRALEIQRGSSRTMKTHQRFAMALGIAATSAAVCFSAVSLATADDGWTTQSATEEVALGRDIDAMHEQAEARAKRSQARVAKLDQTMTATGKKGPRGPRGPRGPAGPQGPSGVLNIYSVVSPTFTVSTNGSGDYTATCTSGGKAISGGFIQADTPNFWLSTSIVGNSEGEWIYSVTNGSSVFTASVFFETICAL